MTRVLIFVVLSTFWLTGSAVAQKFGYVDTEFVFGKMPDYQKAQTELDKFADKWSRDIQDKYVEIEKLQRAYQAEEILMPDDLKRDRQKAISDKEREAREYNNKVFGYEGLLFLKKKELMKGPMETVNRAIEKIAIQKKLDFVFDKASDFVMLYTNPRHDYTDYVLEELGLDADSQKTKAAASATTKSTTPAPVSPKPADAPVRRGTNAKPD